MMGRSWSTGPTPRQQPEAHGARALHDLAAAQLRRHACSPRGVWTRCTGVGGRVKRRALAAAGVGGIRLVKRYNPIVIGLLDPLGLRLQPQLNSEMVAYCGETP